MSAQRKVKLPAPGALAYDAIHKEALRLQREAGCFRSFLTDVTTHDRAALCEPNDRRTQAALWIARPCGSHLVWLANPPTSPDPMDGSTGRWRREWREDVAFARMVLDTFGPGQFLYRLDVERGVLYPFDPAGLDRLADECEPFEAGE